MQQSCFQTCMSTSLVHEDKSESQILMSKLQVRVQTSGLNDDYKNFNEFLKKNPKAVLLVSSQCNSVDQQTVLN